MAATTMATMAIINAKCLNSNSPKLPTKLSTKPTFQNLPNGLTTSSKSIEIPKMSMSPVAGTAIAGAVFSALSSSDPALAAQQIAQIAEGDNRGLALLLPIIPAIGWVLFNIFQPALNQINRMQSKGVVVGLGLGGLAASGFMSTPHAAASEIAMIAADAPAGDNRGQLLLFVVAPAILWVLYNILQPALNQINKMRS